MAAAEKQIQEILSSDKLEELKIKAVDWALSHGFALRTKEAPLDGSRAEHAPFALFPSPVPAPLFNQATDVQRLFNLLYHKVALHAEFLEHCLQEAVKADDFVRSLWEIYQQVEQEGGRPQPVTLELSRSDYMIDAVAGKAPTLKQVEYNTIASSMISVSHRAGGLHRYIAGEADLTCKEEELPRNGCVENMAAGLAEAWKAYGKAGAVIVFVVIEKPERMIYDQRILEYAVREACPGAKVCRKTLPELADEASLAEDRSLMLGDKEVAVCYFRSGYSPGDYTSPKTWEVRLLLERSRAILSPTMAYQLAGMKKVQQELCRPGALEKYLTCGEAAQVRACFAMQYSLGQGEEGRKAVQLALQSPENFVLKPQREGGGNNTYGRNIVPVLEAQKDSLSSYILMERIRPYPSRNLLMVAGCDCGPVSAVSELGIYGVFISAGGETLVNQVAGHLLRTKPEHVDEGGVASGFAVLDSPLLVTDCSRAWC